MGTEVKGERDAWYIDKSVTVSLSDSMSAEDLLGTLNKNRDRLEHLKKQYCKAPKNTQSRTTHFHEIIRVVNAIEAIKNRLTMLAQPFNISDRDLEHPDDACSRFCFVANAVYGVGAAEVETLRRFRDMWLQNSTFGRNFIRLYYLLGPFLSRVVKQSDLLTNASRKIISYVILHLQRLEHR